MLARLFLQSISFQIFQKTPEVMQFDTEAVETSDMIQYVLMKRGGYRR